MNWKTTLLLLSTVLIVLIIRFSDQIGNGVHKVEAYYSNKFHQTVAKGLYEGFKKTAEKINKRGPVMQNKYVRFDKAEAGPGARITNFYTLVTHSSRDFNRTEFSDRLRTNLVKAMCNSTKVRPSLILGATYAFVYRCNDGVEVSRVAIDQHSCETPSAQTAKP